MPRRATKSRLDGSSALDARVVDAVETQTGAHVPAGGEGSLSAQTTAPRARAPVRRQPGAPAAARRSGSSSSTFGTRSQPSGERHRAMNASPESGDSVVIPAVTLPSHDGASDARSDSSSLLPNGIPSQRALVPAQRLTRKESALVARQTQQLPGLADTRATKAVTVVGPSGHETTVLPARRRATPARALPLLAPRRRGRRPSLIGGILVAIATLAVVAGALYTVSPFSPIRSQSAQFAPAAAMLALSSADGPPGGPWDTSSGTTEALGLGGGAGPGVNAPGSAGLPVTDSGGGGNFTASPGAVFISAPPVSPWPPSDPFMEVPDHPAYRVNRPTDGYYWWAFGQCTWWAQYTRRDENLTYLGNARGWATAAQARGYRVGHQAAPNATVVFFPGAEGAGGAGHVAHVEAVYPGGWFLVSEMNFYWNGGGWGRVDYRFAHEGQGVAFIY